MPKSNISTNERELAGQVSVWFNEFIKNGKYPFSEATIESGVRVDKKMRFGDIILWTNRSSHDAFSYLELKPPFGASEDLETFRQKAIQYRVRFAFTWDFQTLNAYTVRDNIIEHIGSENTPVLNHINDWLRGDIQVTLRKYIHRICDELTRIQETGKFHKFIPEKVYFINFIRSVKEKLTPHFENFIRKSSLHGVNRKKISEYCAKQGILNPSEEFQKLAEQTVYGLITKIIFYLTIRRYFKTLPDLFHTEEQDLATSIRHAFMKAREIDWQAIFEEDPIEEFGIPREAYPDLLEFFGELRAYHFGDLAEDVIGQLFEEIIDPEQRHRLGQYFTREDLVDLIIGAVVNDPKGVYADPTCGSGTFLVRLYDRLRYLSSHKAEHRDLLNQIWGFDVGKFPAELATINLFRQKVDDFANFPRIQCTDVFDVLPGKIFKYPPAQAGKHFDKVEQAVPSFDGLVGNFPFIRQEEINRKISGYKAGITTIQAKNHFSSYPKLFTRKANVAIDPARGESLENAVKSGFLELNLSGQADIYAYLFLHTEKFLKPGGAIAIITSNSWLDVAYGAVLKEFLMDHFRIRMIVASWAEPWFEDAAVNTVFTVLEKEENPERRRDNTIRFVKLKKKLSHLIPFADLRLESEKRWRRVDDILYRIDMAEGHKKCRTINAHMRSYEDDDMRIRLISQSYLMHEVETKKDLDRWGKYLRAPDVYFEILDKCKDKLVPLKEVADVRRGYTTGINDFFYLEVLGEKKGVSICKNSKNEEVSIESKYLRKVIKSPKEADTIVINPDKLKYSIFMCDKSKSELKKSGDMHALKYIEWGEKQRTEDGVLWSEVPSVSSRKLWYCIDEKQPGYILLQMINNDRFASFLNKDNVQVDHNLFELNVSNKRQVNTLESYLNSYFFALVKEVNSRANLGDGATKTEGIDWNNLMLVPKEPFKNNIEIKKLIGRKVYPAFEEVKQKDRQELDSEILKALGLDAKEFLPRIYDGLTEMVRERLDLPKMRKSLKKQTVKVSYDKIKSSVIADCLPDGAKRFPHDFYHSDIKDKKMPADYDSLEFETFPTTGQTLSSKEFFGKFEIRDTRKTLIAEVNSADAAEFVKLLDKPDIFQIRLPKSEKVIKKILTAHKQYIKDIQLQIFKDAYSKLHDEGLAERMTREILSEYGII